jgi:hypothetical protein
VLGGDLGRRAGVGYAGVWREHRTVVLPDFQGVGIGDALSEWLGAYLRSWGIRIRSLTSHPRDDPALEEVLIILQRPSSHNKESIADVDYWFKALIRRARRKAGLPSRPEG